MQISRGLYRTIIVVTAIYILVVGYFAQGLADTENIFEKINERVSAELHEKISEANGVWKTAAADEQLAYTDTEGQSWISSAKGILRWWLPPVPEGDVDILKHFEIMASENIDGEYTLAARTIDYNTEYPVGMPGEIALSEVIKDIEFVTGYVRVRAVNVVGLKSEMSLPLKIRIDNTPPSRPNSNTIKLIVPPEMQVNIIRE